MKKNTFLFSFLFSAVFFAGCSMTLTPQEKIYNFELIKKALIKQDKYKEAQKIQKIIDKIKKENGIPVNCVNNNALKNEKKNITGSSVIQKTPMTTSTTKKSPVMTKKSEAVVKIKKSINKRNTKKEVKQRVQKTVSNKTNSKQKPKKEQSLFKIYSVKNNFFEIKKIKENNETKFDILNEIKK